MSTIEIRSVTKRFGPVTAVDDFSATLEQNKIYGLLGRNGAGKSTLFHLITGRLFPSSGTITYDGAPILENDRVLENIFCVSEFSSYLPEYRIRDVFAATAAFYPNFDMECARRLADAFSLSLSKRVKGLSTGYQSIFKNIVALASNTPFLFLDEPVLGLDANHRELFYRELMAGYGERPRTIVLSTHLIEEVSGLVEHIIIIKAGKKQVDAPIEEVMRMGYCVSGPAAAVDAYVAGRQVLSVQALGGLKTACLLGEPESSLPAGLERAPLDLQSLFIQLTNA